MIPRGFRTIYKKDIKSVWEEDNGVLVLQQRFFSLFFPKVIDGERNYQDRNSSKTKTSCSHVHVVE